MANKKTDVTLLCRGLGMGMAFLQALTEEIVAAGGFEEMIHFLTKEHARPICKKLAEVIVKSPWQIPRSLMERLAAAESMRDTGSKYVEFDKRYAWGRILEPFGVPITKFYSGGYSSSAIGPVPDSLVNQIVSKPLPYPLIVEWEGEKYIVVGICSDNDENAGEGKIYPPEIGFEQLSIAPAKCFNLEQ